MATTGPALYPGPSTYPGSTTYPGGGDLPQIEVLYSTVDLAIGTPAWTYVNPGDLRGYSVDRGRQSELDEFDAGHATVTLSNRARLFDPTANSLIGPMNRWWIRAKFSGSTYDRFVGYADRYSLSWPERGKDSVTVVECTDETKLLNLRQLPSTSPPADTYEGVVMSDVPIGYWPMKDVPSLAYFLTAAVSDPFACDSTAVNTSYTDGPIVADPSETGTYSVSLAGGSSFNISDSQNPLSSAAQKSIGDIRGLTGWAAELWFTYPTVPAGSYQIMASPIDGAVNYKWQIQLLTTGAVMGYARNNAGTVFTVTSAVLPVDTWHHVVWTLEGGFLKLYVDGVLSGQTAWTAPASSTLNTGVATTMGLGNPGGGIINKISQLAWYQAALSASRVAAHYAAARLGLPQQTVSDRFNAVLDAIPSRASRRGTGTQTYQIQALRMNGQSALDELRKVAHLEAPVGAVYVDRSGWVVFQFGGGRSASIGAVFDDDGTDLRYLDTTQDISESFLYNTWNVNRKGGPLQTISDQASIARYGERTQTLTDLEAVNDTDAANIIVAYVVKYAYPLARVPSVSPDMTTAAVIEAALARELGDKIQIIRRPLGGGSAIDQQSWIQQITESCGPDQIIQLTFNVSPV